ncbi:MAG: CotH kinase family protein [Bacteroidetes bacterium]|nr:CotH kinase family protein [Bacteroidota bacterium]
MKKNIITYIFFLISTTICFSQTFNGTGGLIPDDGTSINFTINVSGLASPLDTINFGLEEVCINATHTWDSDLEISLIAPDGTVFILTSGNGGSDDDYTNTCFRNDAVTPITQGNAPFTGTFRPQGDMSFVNNGQNGNGQWKLHILDTYAFADQGNLLDWSIAFGTNPASPLFSFTSSNLPIVVINTNNQPIPDEPKLTCDMGIIYNGIGVRNYMTGPFNNYNGKIAIEARGSSSQMFPKKSFGFETRYAIGNKKDTILLGMPAEHDWILNASYSDKTHMRNVLSYKLFRDFGRYAHRTQYCELVINGQYQGVYILMERIKRDKNRVNIAKLNTWENAGDSLTGGYIIKIDKTTGNGGAGWTSPFPPVVSSGGQTIYFQYEYPDADSITIQQQNYIQQYVDSFETSLAAPNFTDTSIGYAKYCGVNTFIDYFILNEVSKNIDGYRLSTYLYKDKYSKGGKLKIGHPWDYDIAWLNADYCGSPSYTDWAYEFGNVCSGDFWQVPFWWNRFMQDSNFTDNLKCRWIMLRNSVLDTGYLFSYIDSSASYLNEGMGRNFITWPILGVYVWPNPSPIPITYQGEINRLKLWISNRLTWLDTNMPGNCLTTSLPSYPSEKYFSVYPNPSKGVCRLSPTLSKKEGVVEVYSVLGERVLSLPFGKGGDGLLDLSNQPNGIYILKIFSGEKLILYKLK